MSAFADREQFRFGPLELAIFDFFADWVLLPFEQKAADEFEQLRSAKIRVATSDLKIAAIALVNNALLLTANRQDFEKIPGLRFEDWLRRPQTES